MVPRGSTPHLLVVVQSGLNQSDNITNLPKLPGNSGFHCWRATQSFMNLAKIVMEGIERQGVNVIFDLLGEAESQTGKSAVHQP